MSETSPTAADFESIGVYDPNGPHAADRLELLQYLVDLGASLDDLAVYRDELAGLASVVAIRGGRAVSLSEAAMRSGVTEEKFLAISRAAGFPQPGPHDRVFAERFGDFVAGLAAGEAVFGHDGVLQLARVMGATMNRLADAIVSAFLVNVEPGVSEQDPAGLRVARANAEASALLPTLGPGLEILLRQHLLAARRSSFGVAVHGGYESRFMCVGFVDLVASTALAQHMTTSELGSVLGEFERIASDTVNSAGGRVVKLIGDEILYVSADAQAACAIALQLTTAFERHPTVPAARAGVASGEVMMRDGDVFGPVVNLAARAVELAAPSEVIVPTAMALAACTPSEPLGRQTLKGFDGDVQLSRLTRAALSG